MNSEEVLQVHIWSEFAGYDGTYDETEKMFRKLESNMIELFFGASRRVRITNIGSRVRTVPAKCKTLEEAVDWCIGRAKKEQF